MEMNLIIISASVLIGGAFAIYVLFDVFARIRGAKFPAIIGLLEMIFSWLIVLINQKLILRIESFYQGEYLIFIKGALLSASIVFGIVGATLTIIMFFYGLVVFAFKNNIASIIIITDVPPDMLAAFEKAFANIEPQIIPILKEKYDKKTVDKLSAQALKKMTCEIVKTFEKSMSYDEIANINDPIEIKKVIFTDEFDLEKRYF